MSSDSTIRPGGPWHADVPNLYGGQTWQPERVTLALEPWQYQHHQEPVISMSLQHIRVPRCH